MPICICTHCNKPFEASRKSKACSTTCRNNLYRKAHLEISREWSRNSYHKTKDINRQQRLYKYAKARAIKKGIPFNLDITDIVIPELCPILKVPFASARKYSASIDRINPELGYVKGNIQIISQVANAMKWDSTREERLAFATWVLSSEGG